MPRGTDQMLLECSHGIWYDGHYVNGKSLKNNILQDVTYRCPYCSGNEQYTQCQTSDLAALQKYSPRWIWWVISSWRSEWIEEFVSLWIHVMGSRLFVALGKHIGTWGWKTETECSKVRCFVLLWKYAMGLGIEKLKLSTVMWGFLWYYGNM